MKLTKTLNSALLLALLTAAASTAAPAAHTFAETAVPPILQIDPPAFINVNVNGHALDPHKSYVFMNEKDQYMIPVRDVAESLGYTLTWNDKTRSLELTKGNRWSSITIGQDRYNFAKMNISLGTAPLIHEEKTYVPLAFISDVLKEDVVVNDTLHITITEKQDVDSVTKAGTITSLTLNDDGGRIGLNGFGYGMNLNITDKTEIVGSNQEKLKPADLKLGMSIEVVPDKFQTMSIPPMTNAVKIVVKEASAADVLGTAGEISAVTELSDGTKQITVKGEKLADGAYETISLTLSADTNILATKDNHVLTAADLKQGQRVYAFYGPRVTRSLPPIGHADKIVLESGDPLAAN